MAADVLAFVRTLIGSPKRPYAPSYCLCYVYPYKGQISWLRLELIPMQTIMQGNIEINEGWVRYPMLVVLPASFPLFGEVEAWKVTCLRMAHALSQCSRRRSCTLCSPQNVLRRPSILGYLMDFGFQYYTCKMYLIVLWVNSSPLKLSILLTQSDPTIVVNVL
jgi:hypothetical protein